MDTAAIIVTVGGAALVALILWFFFGPRTASQARKTGDGGQEVDIEVRGAYSPDRVEVEQGRPVRLTFIRKEANACTAQVVFPDFGIVKDLPVEFKALRAQVLSNASYLAALSEDELGIISPL